AERIRSQVDAAGVPAGARPGTAGIPPGRHAWTGPSQAVRSGSDRRRRADCVGDWAQQERGGTGSGSGRAREIWNQELGIGNLHWSRAAGLEFRFLNSKFQIGRSLLVDLDDG